MLYFAYGSNLNHFQMKRRCKDSFFLKKYELKGYRLNFKYYNKRVMTYLMVKKTKFRYPTERYLNIIKQGYKDCKLEKKYLIKALNSNK